MSQSLELNRRHHVMHLLPEVECGPKAWTVLKEVHAPTSVVATLMLERELYALRLSEGELVQPVLEKRRHLYAKLAIADQVLEDALAAARIMASIHERIEPAAEPKFVDARNRHQDGGALRNQKNGGNTVADSSDNNPKSNGSAEKKERTAGQFFHIGEQGEQGDASAKVGEEQQPLDYWVLDTGTAWTMTPRKELLDDVQAAPINEVCSASGHALKGSNGKPVVLHDVLLVPNLKANLISLHKLAKAGVSTSTDAACTDKGQLGNQVPWDLHESKDMYRSMWQLPALARNKKPLELVHIDLVGPLLVQGHKGERYFLTIVDDWSSLMWAYPLKQKDHAAFTRLEDWLSFLDKQAECVVKRIRTNQCGEFLGAEMMAWLKKQGIQRELTMAYTPQSIDVEERANWTILETARALLIESEMEAKESQEMEQITMQLDLTPSVSEEGEVAAAERGDVEKVQEAPAGGGDDEEPVVGPGKLLDLREENNSRQAKKPKLPQRRKLKGVIMN
ncbi:unnamed protein product [Closterium sp. NIES-54]